MTQHVQHVTTGRKRRSEALHATVLADLRAAPRTVPELARLHRVKVDAVRVVIDHLRRGNRLTARKETRPRGDSVWRWTLVDAPQPKQTPLPRPVLTRQADQVLYDVQWDGTR